MQIIEKNIAHDLLLLEKITNDPSKFLLLDIETTGFSSTKNQIYLIGFISVEAHQLKLTQWLCEKEADEFELLYRFSKMLTAEYTIINYNGSSFDIPFIKKRLEMYKISSQINEVKQIDLYHELKPLHTYLNLENLKLKTVEKAFGFHRRDINTGGTLINIYFDYIKNQMPHLQELILLHNEEDLLGLYYIINAYDQILFFRNATTKTFSTDALFIDIQEGILKLSIPYHSNFKTTIRLNPYTIEIAQEEICIFIPIHLDTLYFYFPDYQSYYYLPLEDMAVHRSIGQFVDKEHRKKATKLNCYIKKRGTFIPLIKSSTTTLTTYKYNLKDSLHYVELTEDLLKDNHYFSQLFSQILSSL
ncbi:MAG: hypothetical protein CVU84_03350 [Firmicutes bacterium HGW-Firmicutes-1]|jgi:hypothetical protein|nr:MAG: hypothetical protein CVU84_03350 [Firmicutes bacterium HGW-Firmicutes-1]